MHPARSQEKPNVPDGIRTRDHPIKSRVLYQLSYGHRVDMRGIEPLSKKPSHFPFTRLSVCFYSRLFIQTAH